MAERPMVSVIIPTFNRFDLLPRAVRSVLGQTFSDLELIIVDDGSRDKTPKIVEKFKVRDNRVRYIRLRENQGGPRARNIGIKAARGKYIALLDDDDQWLSKKLEWQVEKFHRLSKKVGVVYGGYRKIFVDQEREDQIIRPRAKGEIFQELLRGCPIGSPTNLIRRDCFDRIGLFDVKLKSCQDWDLWLRIGRYYQFEFVDRIVANYYLHRRSQISASADSQISGRLRMLKKYQKDLNKQPKIASLWQREVVKYYTIAGRRKEALRFQRQILELELFNLADLKTFFWLFFSFPSYRQRVQKE